MQMPENVGTDGVGFGFFLLGNSPDLLGRM
jgi:hypothetical protein